MLQDTMPKHAWLVRAGNNNELIEAVEKQAAIAIGWAELGDPVALNSRDDFKSRYTAVYPGQSAARVNVNAGQVYRYTREIALGDYVLTYDKATRELLIGLVSSSVEFNPKLFGQAYPYTRRVNWLKRVSRDNFGVDSRNSLGSSLTVFNLDDYVPEIHQLSIGATVSTTLTTPSEVEEPFHEQVKARADELIADAISRLDPYDFQDLVAGVLEAMGFRARRSPPGPDHGVDIIAYPDALGFEHPCINVQVKHVSAKVSGPDMRNFVATLAGGKNGLFVSTGGFSSEAHAEADRARETVTMLDRDAFVELMLEYYDKLDPEFQAQIPLRKLWVPVTE